MVPRSRRASAAVGGGGLPLRLAEEQRRGYDPESLLDIVQGRLDPGRRVLVHGVGEQQSRPGDLASGAVVISSQAYGCGPAQTIGGGIAVMEPSPFR